MTGLVLSTLNSALSLPTTELPATSEQPSEVTLTAEPSLLVVLDWTLSPAWLAGKFVLQASLRPEPKSLALKVLVISVVYQLLLPFGWLGVGPRSLIVGAFLSTLMPVMGPAVIV